jgi:outer membrane protein assembly factor BamB
LLISCTFNSWIKTHYSQDNSNNFVYAFDINDGGKKKWDLQISGNIFSSPCVCDDMIIIGTLNSKIYAIDLGGNIVWTFNTGNPIWSSPATFNNKIFLGSDDFFLYSLDIDGNLHWKTKLEGKIRATPCLMPSTNSIFIGTHRGIINCITLSDGSIKWKYDFGKPILSSVAISNDYLFFGCSDNCIYCLSIVDGAIKWKYETANKIWSSPLIIANEGILFVGSLDSHIYGLDSETGKLNWKFPTMDLIDSSPCAAKNMLFVNSRDGLLYCFINKNISSVINKSNPPFSFIV